MHICTKNITPILATSRENCCFRIQELTTWSVADLPFFLTGFSTERQSLPFQKVSQQSESSREQHPGLKSSLFRPYFTYRNWHKGDTENKEYFLCYSHCLGGFRMDLFAAYLYSRRIKPWVVVPLFSIRASAAAAKVNFCKLTLKSKRDWALVPRRLLRSPLARALDQRLLKRKIRDCS